jgi:HEAT repeat protein
VALEAVRRAGASRVSGAVSALARLVVQGDPEMRLASVQALSEIGSAGALQQVERALDDDDRDVRVAAAKALAARTHRAALARVENAIRSKRLQDSDLTEKMAFFEAYGAICGDGGIATLDGYLNGRGLFGRKENSETRACAARALGRIGSQPALDVLRKASNDKEILVRNAVNRALRGDAPA